MARSPKSGAIAGKPAVADVHDRDSQLFPEQDFEVAEHVPEPRLPSDRHRWPGRERLFGGNGGGQTKPERGDIAPAQKAAGQERVIDGAELIPRVAGFMGDERVL